jgi:catechol 2,3-dioxygenase-like lactoylglutathione lyase family enzyme
VIDHLKLFVADLERSAGFYEQALAPLGYAVKLRHDELGVAFGRERPELWLAHRPELPTTVAHVALRADDRATVDAFHAAALAAGGTDNGGPGLRPQYHPSYYGAFVLDPDGNNLEAVCHARG